jgi:hypothetical protein
VQGLIASRVFQASLVGAALFSLAVGVARAAAPVVENGGFETQDLSGWKVRNSAAFKWEVYTGDTLPTDSTPFPPPPRGDWAAAAEQGFISQGFLYQNLKLPDRAQELKFITYYESSNSFATPHDFNATADDHDNQQYRVDLVRPHAPIKSLDSGDVIKNLFRTRVGDPPTLDPTLVTTDVTQWAGKTVRLRFAVADNKGPLAVGIDAVKVKLSH